MRVDRKDRRIRKFLSMRSAKMPASERLARRSFGVMRCAVSVVFVRIVLGGSYFRDPVGVGGGWRRAGQSIVEISHSTLRSRSNRGRHFGPGRRHAQSQARRRRSAAREAHRHHGAFGLGEEFACVRHALCRGQRRYVESLSVYARQFLELMPRPEVSRSKGSRPRFRSTRRAREQSALDRRHGDRIGGLPAPPFCARRDAPLPDPRSCASRRPVAAMVDRTLTLSEGVRLMVLAPIVRGGQKDVGREIEPLFVKGFTRFRIDGEVVMLERAPPPGSSKAPRSPTSSSTACG